MLQLAGAAGTLHGTLGGLMRWAFALPVLFGLASCGGSLEEDNEPRADGHVPAQPTVDASAEVSTPDSVSEASEDGAHDADASADQAVTADAPLETDSDDANETSSEDAPFDATPGEDAGVDASEDDGPVSDSGLPDASADAGPLLQRWLSFEQGGQGWVVNVGSGLPPQPTVRGSWSPDGKKLVATVFKGPGAIELQIVDVSSGAPSAPTVLATTPYDPQKLWWSPDSQRIAMRAKVGVVNRLFVVGLSGALPKTLSEVGNLKADETVHYGEQIGWSPDGQWLGFKVESPSTPRLYVSPADSSALPFMVGPTNQGVYDWSWARAGALLQLITYNGGKFELRVADSSAGFATTLLDSASLIVNVEWAPEGDRLAYRRGSSAAPPLRLYLANAKLGTAPVDISSPAFNQNDGAAGQAWSPDGKRIAFLQDRPANVPSSCCNFQGVFVADVGASSASMPIDITTTDSSDMMQPIWSPDSSRLAFAQGFDKLFITDFSDGKIKPAQVLASGFVYHYTIAFAPDSSAILFEQESAVGHQLLISALATGGPPVPIFTSTGFASARWSPDGAYVAFVGGFVVPVSGGVPGTPKELNPSNGNYNGVLSWSPKILK